jgi:hypothetical protein
MQWITIDGEVYPIDHEEDLEAARLALWEAGLTQAEVWVGDPESPEASDTYTNGRILRA